MVDTHCHLFKEYYDNIDEIVSNMKDNYMIVSGNDDESNKEVMELIEKYPNVFGTIGIHPSSVDNISKKDLDFIEKNISHPKIVAIGEVGLDYHYGKNNIEKQKEIFLKQIKIAKDNKKTILIHSRDSIEDTYNILKENINKEKIILHCYSSSYEMAKRFLEFNVMFGIGGVLTFKNSKTLKEVVEKIDIEYLLLETDSPYLSPEPLRGLRNQPINITLVAQKIADLKNISLEEVLKTTTDNAKSQFDLNI
ncbi:MAG: TatD family hydrolase [Bacilli bacterium]|nr:TatD family hydrolase [Bacilli bacterium]MDD4733267.1 TatD family hydrolase [Bacilli bacterium]